MFLLLINVLALLLIAICLYLLVAYGIGKVIDLLRPKPDPIEYEDPDNR